MPSRLGRLRSPFQTISAQQQVDMKVLPVYGPWGGLVRGVAPDLLDMKAFETVQGLVPAGERLATDYGWVPYQISSQLPLGGRAVGLPAANGHPVVALMVRVNPDTGDRISVAMTAKVGTTEGALFWRLAGDWSEAPPASHAIDRTSAAPVSHTFHPGGAHGSPAERGTLIFTNGLASESRVYFYPNSTGLYDVVTFPSSTWRAHSLTFSRERLFLYNLIDNDGARLVRVRWSIPGLTTLTSATNWTGRGAGAMDLFETGTVGRQILGIGDSVAVYGNQGIVLLRPTGEVQAPYRKQVLTTRRGSLGVNCAIEIERGVHFVICTDGWFLLTEDGDMKELGYVSQGGVSLGKWTQEFYAKVRRPFSDKIALGYDPIRRFIYVSWPDANCTANGDPNRLWIYDLRGDRVWEDPYTIFGGPNHNAVCFGFQARVTGSFSGTWAANANPWEGIDNSAEPRLLTHGTVGGRVWQHEPTVWSKGGVANSPWSITGHPFAYGDPTRRKSILHRVLNYVANGEATSLLTVLFQNHPEFTNVFVGAYTHATEIPYTQTPAGAIRTIRISPHISGVRFRQTITGFQPACLLGWTDEYVGTLGEE